MKKLKRIIKLTLNNMSNVILPEPTSVKNDQVDQNETVES